MFKPIRAIALMPRLPEPAAVAALSRAALEFVLFAALAFALSRATLATLAPMAMLAPLAMALFAAGVTHAGRAAAMLAGCALGSVRGSVDTYNLSALIGCAVILAGTLAAGAIREGASRLERLAGDGARMSRLIRLARRTARSPNDVAACAGLAGAGVLVPGLIYAGARPWPSAQAVAAALAALAAAPFMRAALRVRPNSRYLLPEERAGLFLLAAGVVMGLYTLFPPVALLLGGGAATLASPAGALLGPGLGAGVLMVSENPGPALALALCGATSQLCEYLPKFVWAATVAAVGLAASAFAGLNPPAIAALCVAPPLVMLLPEAFHARVRRWCRRRRDTCDPDRLASLLRGQTASRLRAMSAAFGDLAEGYLTPAVMPDEQALMNNLRAALCDGCPGYGDCWGETNRGGRLLCDLVAMAVDGADGELFEAGVPADIARRCRRARQLPERVGEALRDFALARRAELKRGGENRLISAQFLQARQLADTLAEEQSRPIRLRDRQARRAAAVLERGGIAVSDALLISGRRTELILTLREGCWSGELAGEASRRLNRAFGRVYAPESLWGPTARFVRQPRLRAGVGAGSLSREPGESNGDSHLTAMLDDERLLVLICDGMGSGPAAARESAQAARLLGRFLAAGAAWELAIETVNALMLNISSEDMFSTVDMLILNLSTGMAEFMKLAACPALIVRDGRVERVEGGRLPLGILERVQPAASRVTLMPGDTVVMVSDGVMDAADPDALEAMIASPEEDMNALAERVLRLAADGAGGHRDDMTAVCVRVGENAA